MVRKYLYMAMAALSLVGLPVSGAYAQNFGGDNGIRPYAGVGIGVFGLELKGINGVLPSQKETVFGGYGKFGVDLGDYFGGEVRVGSMSSGTKNFAAGTPITSTTVSTVAVDSKISANYFVSYFGKAQFPVTPDLRVYALLGGTTARVKLTGSSVFGSTNLSTTKTGLSYGFGAQYYLLDTLSVGGEWVQYWTSVNVNPNTETKLWGAVGTLAYHF